MKKKVVFYLSNLMLIIMSVMIFSPVIVKAGEILIWEGKVFADSTDEVIGPTLENGEIYRIVASGVFFYDPPTNPNYAADAQYYTTGTDPWVWTDNFLPLGGQSFLRINGLDVYWGLFNNGNLDGVTGHTYSIYYTGEGTPITFIINDYFNKREVYDSHFDVKIYWVPSVGGYIVGSNILKVFPLLTFCAFIVALLTTGRIIKIRRNHIR